MYELEMSCLEHTLCTYNVAVVTSNDTGISMLPCRYHAVLVIVVSRFLKQVATDTPMCNG